MLNGDYLVNSQYLHVRHGVAVARNPPTAKEEVAWKMLLGENLVRTRGGSPQERRRCGCTLKTELVKKFKIFCISGMEGLIDMERKGCESIRCYTHFATFNIDLTHDLDLGFSRSDFEKVISLDWDGRLT